MKKLLTFLFLIFCVINLQSSPKSFIKLYFINGKPSEVFLIDDIGKMTIKKFSNNFTLTIYYQKSLSESYQTSAIDTMKFENDKFNIYLSLCSKTFLVSLIDSLIFIQNKDIINDTTCTKLWMKKNLDIDHYRNGDPIPEVTDPTAWKNLTTGAWCYYDNDKKNGVIYGKLYNWFAVNDPRGLVPDGWHVPTEAEWTELSNCLGSDCIAGGKLKSTGTIESGDGLWLNPNTGATNTSFFSGLPGGYRYYNGYFNYINSYGIWWSSSEYDGKLAWDRSLHCYSSNINSYYDYKACGYSVRCIKDK